MATSTSPSNSVLKHSSIYAIGNISRQLVGFLMLPIYTRFLTPEDYGVVALLAFVVILLEGAIGARLAAAVPKYYFDFDTQKDRNCVVSTALIITSTISLVAVVSLFLYREAGATLLFGQNELGLALGLYGIQLLTSALEAYGLLFIRILNKPLLFLSLNLSKLVVQVLLNIWFIVHLELGYMGVVYASLASNVLFALLIGIYTLIRTGVRFNWEVGREMLVFSWPLWISGISIFYVSASSRYYINLFGSLEDVGFFELGTKFASILTVLIWSPFLQYWEAERFRILSNENANENFQRVFAGISPLMALAMLSISVFSPTVLKLMAAPEFYPTVKVIPILATGELFTAFLFFFNFSFMVKKNTSFILRNNIVAAAVVTALYFTLIPQYGYFGAAIALMATRLLLFLWVFWTSRKAFDMGISIADFLRLSALCAICGISIGSVSWSENPISDFLIRLLLWSLSILLAYVVSPNTRSLFRLAISTAKHARTKIVL